MLTIPPEAFDAHLLVDVYRAVAGAAGVIFVLFAIKVAYLRWRRDDPPTVPLALAWMACATFALATTGLATERLGQPFDVVCVLYGLGLLFGYSSLASTLEFVLIPPWLRRITAH